MVKKRDSGSEKTEIVRASEGRQKQPSLAPAGRPQPENLAEINEQLRTEVEELRRQVLELRERKDEGERSISGAERLARLPEENPDPVLQVSLRGVVRYRNPAAFPLCRQWNPQDELVVPPALHKLVEAAHATAKVIRQEMTVGGPTYLVTVAPAPALADYVNIYVSDITACKQAEEVLKVRDSALASSLNAIAMADLQGRLTYVNPAFLRLWGYEEDREVLGRPVLEFWEEPQRAAEVMQAIQHGGGWVGELVAVKKDGAHRNLYLSASTVRNDEGAPLCLMGSFVDITRRKRAEEGLRESEERLHLALGAARMGAWQWEVGTQRVAWSPELYALLGYEPGQVTPTHEAFRQRIHPPDLPRWEQALWESMEHGEDYSCEFRVVWSDGSVHWVEARGQYAHTGDESAGKTLWMRGVLSDIEQRKHVEEALRASEQRYRKLFEANLAGAYITKLDGSILDFNDAMMRMLGYGSREEVFQHHSSDFYADPQFRDGLMRLLQKDGIVPPKEAVLRRKDGSVLHALGSAVLLVDEQTGEPYIQGLAIDITERKRAEEALRELTATLESKVTQRTAQLRRRARQLQKLTLEISEAEDRERKRLAGILHDDVQQIIAAAKFHLSVLRNRVKDDAPVQAIGAQIDQMLKEAVEKSRGLSHELSPAALYADFAEALDQLASQMQAQHGLLVQVHARGQVPLQSDAVKAFVYRTAQELLFNAVKHAQVKEARIRVRRLGRYLCLTVSDRGCGFDPQELREAAGFGLLSIRERIELLGGRMKIKSTRGKGSTFFLVVPDGETPEDTAVPGAVT